jgi:hypothetical protein
MRSNPQHLGLELYMICLYIQEGVQTWKRSYLNIVLQPNRTLWVGSNSNSISIFYQVLLKLCSLTCYLILSVFTIYMAMFISPIRSLKLISSADNKLDYGVHMLWGNTYLYLFISKINKCIYSLFYMGKLCFYPCR